VGFSWKTRDAADGLFGLDVLRYDRGVTAMILLIPNANENELVRSIYLSS